MKKPKIRNWAFLQPVYSRHTSEFFAGMLSFLKDHPNIFIHIFTFDEIDRLKSAKVDGIISYSTPPDRFLDDITGVKRARIPLVVITTDNRRPGRYAIAHIDPLKIAEHVVSKLMQRHCRSFAFCTNHTAFITNESAQLLLAFRRVVEERTGSAPYVYRPKVTRDTNLIPEEMERFVKWFRTLPKPCGMFAHGDDVAKKMLDTCRLYGIDVPREMRVIGRGNSQLFCERTIPTLSSISVNHEKVGFDSARALYAMSENGSSPEAASFEVSIPDVIERGSSLDKLGSGRFATEARSYIRGEIDRGRSPSVNEVASHFNLSRSKAQKDFLEIIGHTLHAEVSEYRLEKLASLLKSSPEPVKLVATRAGFASYSQADRAFQARFKKTMSEFRRG